MPGVVVTMKKKQSRSKRNGRLSHATFSGSGCNTQGKMTWLPASRSQNRKKPSGRKPVKFSASRYTLAPPQRAWVRYSEADTTTPPCAIFFFQAEDGIRDGHVTGVQTCALPI